MRYFKRKGWCCWHRKMRKWMPVKMELVRRNGSIELDITAV